jgi:hypothetical protein
MYSNQTKKDKNFICGVTSKYLKAISRKIWIVSIFWILASVNQSKLIDPVIQVSFE